MSLLPVPAKSNEWLEENGPRSLDLLARAIGIDDAPLRNQSPALYLLDKLGFVAVWYAGAKRLYGFSSEEAMHRHVSFLYSSLCDGIHVSVAEGRQKVDRELMRSTSEGHLSTEHLQIAKNGSSFWASTMTLALKDNYGEFQGHACLARDFSDIHEQESSVGLSAGLSSALATTASAIVSGEFEIANEANDVFLNLLGYTREDFAAGLVRWTELTPHAFAAADRYAREEELKFGACTPYEKELISKDGTLVPVTVGTAVMKLCPFRWVAFIQDRRNCDQAQTSEALETDGTRQFSEMVGTSAALKRNFKQIELVAPTDATVLILGETGTGKELIARAIHRLSPRRERPCVTLNCAAIPTGLLESELFGYERGAFTGALTQKIGRFEMANHGTLFLDEVGDIPMDLQPKLLRALQEKSFERLGGTKTIPIDVRLVAATNRNLNQMMADNLFRSDLYYRLKVFPITAPPLRDRPEDIPALVHYFVKKYSGAMNRDISKIAPRTMEALRNWSWPGNVRELENFIERAVILSTGSSLQVPLNEIAKDAPGTRNSSTLEQVEREYITRILRDSNGVVTIAATRLGLHRTTLNAMMRKLGILRRDL